MNIELHQQLEVLIYNNFKNLNHSSTTYQVKDHFDHLLKDSFPSLQAGTVEHKNLIVETFNTVIEAFENKVRLDISLYESVLRYQSEHSSELMEQLAINVDHATQLLHFTVELSKAYILEPLLVEC